MLSTYTRCCYTTMRQMVERPKSRQTVLTYYIDWAVFIYAFRYYYIAPLIYSGFPTLPFFDWTLDPMCYFFYRFRNTFDSFVPMIFLLLSVFNILMRYLIYNLNVNTLTWRWWYQLVVENQDLYYENFISQLELAAIRRHREAETLAMLKRNNYAQLLPGIVLVLLSKVYARFLVFKHLDHVNKEQLFRSKLSVMPGLSNRMRVIMLFTTIMADKLITVVQILASMFAYINTLLFYCFVVICLSL